MPQNSWKVAKQKAEQTVNKNENLGGQIACSNDDYPEKSIKRNSQLFEYGNVRFVIGRNRTTVINVHAAFLIGVSSYLE